MAKKTYTHTVDKKTKQVIVVEQAKDTARLIPFTKAPGRIARALWH